MEKKLSLISSILCTISAALYLAARWIPDFSDFYIAHIYRLTAGLFARIFSIFPFSMAEFLLYFLLLYLSAYGMHLIFSVIYTKKNTIQSAFARYGSHCFFLFSILLFLYVSHCGINYYRTDFASANGIPAEAYTKEELAEYCGWLTEQLDFLSSQVTRDQNLSCPSRSEYYGMGPRAMTNLAQAHPSLNQYFPRAKPVWISRILSCQHLCGIYSPFTVEANINKDMPGFYIPFTICHELSHLTGYMQEEEANFIAYLACTQYDSPDFQYSGYLIAYIYAIEALYETDPAAYAQTRQLLNPLSSLDLETNSAFWNQYNGKIAQVSNQINDSYLKANSQTDGVASYDRVVGLLVSYYKSTQNG